MKQAKRWMYASVWVLVLGGSVSAATFENIGSYANWPTQWTPISGVNDPDDGVAEELDFVGDANDPGGYWARNDNYLFFRLRVDQGTLTANTFSGATFVAINVIGENMNPATALLETGEDDGKADYSFSWDSKSNDPTKHGLEMSIRSSQEGPSWSAFGFDDIDGSDGQKLVNDINGSGRTTDGYLRTIDSQNTTSFGTTSFVDYAVSFSYMATYTDLDFDNQTWEVTFASVDSSTDHNPISEDVAGGINPTDLASEGFSNPVPEPATLCVLGFGAVALIRKRRRK